MAKELEGGVYRVLSPNATFHPLRGSENIKKRGQKECKTQKRGVACVECCLWVGHGCGPVNSPKLCLCVQKYMRLITSILSHTRGKGFTRPHSALRTYRQFMAAEKEAPLPSWKR